jgi:hypothetical protein
LLAGFIWLFHSDYLKNRDVIRIPIRHFVLIALLMGFWVAMSGSCGVSVGLNDIPWRNAVLRDLINYNWPVVYDTGYALAYYVVFWMVPAFVGKLLGWGAALFTLWLWETTILLVSFLLISHLVKADKPSTFWMIAIVFLLFSGLNLIGSALTQIVGHNEYGFGLNSNEAYCDNFFRGEATNFYYRSNVDCLEETYNQILIWLAVPLMLQNRKIHSFAFIGIILVPFSPWATIGIIPLMIGLGVIELYGHVKEKGLSKGLLKTVKEVFSPANLGALIGCATVFAAFFLTGAHLSGAEESTSSGGLPFGILTLSAFTPALWLAYFTFCVLEFGLFAFFLYPKFKKDAFFWVVVVWLFIAPLLWVGTISGRDFCMDASLPALFSMMIFMMLYCKDEVMGKPLGFKNLAFVIVLAIAFASPLMELCNQAEIMVADRSVSVVLEVTDITTFEGVKATRIANFVSVSPQETFFFKYLAR